MSILRSWFWKAVAFWHVMKRDSAQDSGDTDAMIRNHMKAQRYVAKAYSAVHGELP